MRLLAVDTPERGECFYSEATEATRAMVDGQRVGLERDVSEWDSLGRLLRHVYLADGQWVNGLVVRGGFAVKTYPPDSGRDSELLALPKLARAEGGGAGADGEGVAQCLDQRCSSTYRISTVR